MAISLAGRVALVTGARQGIGAAIAEALMESGASVVITGRDSGQVSESVSRFADKTGANVQGFVGNVADEADVARLLREVPAIDILVNNAGGFLRAVDTLESTRAEWEQQLAVNLTGPFLICRAVLPGMIERKWGRIVNIGSITASAPALGNATGYVAAKAGLIGFTRQLALEVARHGVTVNAINPGTVATEHLRDYLDTEGAVSHDALTASIPVGRLGAPHEIAGIVPYIASDLGAFMTGAVVEINGGALMA
ncbi:SDR family NAD(P)-dependent oxidoreductase [Neopusillimonas aromaticivorans]|uniref:SDR family NAD(P)-dependent oxidoreductase n=1 Tax=Neopusillimonas aromaticivorans TaxID=2979868 RepID=UPI003D9FA2E5